MYFVTLQVRCEGGSTMAWLQNRHLSPFNSSLIFVFLLIFVSIIAGCNTVPTGSSPSQSSSPTFGPPLKGKVSLFTLPMAGSSSPPIIAGADGNAWFTDGLPSQIAKIERITPTGAIKVFPLPPSDSPGSITAGPDGNLWFTETIIGPKVINSPGPNGQIGRITPAGKISTYRLPSGSVPSHITMGPDHNIWFSEEVAANRSLPVNKIGRITPAGTITEFALPPGNSHGSMGLPVGIASGADGYLWFTDATGNAIGRITTTCTISEFALPTPQSLPVNIAYASGGTLWFTEQGVNDQTGKIGKLTIAT